MVRDHGLAITLFQPFRDFEGLPEPQRSRAFDRAERKFDLMQELGTDLMLVCSNVSPLALGGIDRAAADFRELGERAAQAWPARRLRGAGLGSPRQRPPRRLGDRAARRPSQHRADPRLLPHAGATDRRGHDPRHSRRPHLHRPARRRAAHRHGPAVLEPALPQHARRRRSAGCRLHARGRGDGLRRPALARDLQRPVPRRLAQIDRGRWPPLARLSDGPGAARRAGASPSTCRPCPTASPSAASSSSSSPQTTTEAEALTGLLLHHGLLACCAPQAPGRQRLEARRGPRHQSRRQHRARGLRPFLLRSFTARRPTRFGLRVDDAAATVARARALGAEPFDQRRAAGELAIPAIRGVGGGVIYFIDGKSDLADVWDIEFDGVDDAGRIRTRA